MSAFNDGDLVSWQAKYRAATFYGTLITRTSPGIWIVRTSGGGKIDVTEDRLKKELSR